MSNKNSTSSSTSSSSGSGGGGSSSDDNNSEEKSNSSPMVSTASEWPVTEEWLLTVLSEVHSDHLELYLENEDQFQIVIENFTIKAGCESDETTLSDILAVDINYKLVEVGQPDKTCFLGCIVKLLPQDPFYRVFITEAEFDLREIMFYTEIVPDLNEFQSKYLNAKDRIELPIPRCYHAHHCFSNVVKNENAETLSILPDSVLVLENMKLKNFATVNFAKGLTLKETRSALKSIAKMHAITLAFKVKQDMSLLKHYPHLFKTTQATESYQQLVEKGLPQVVHFLQNRAGFEPVLDALDNLKPKIKEIISLLLSPKEPISVITHTDFWSNNLMFRNEDECLIYDWQMVSYGHPTNDVALLLISSVSTELRKSHTDNLLGYYWQLMNEYTTLFHLNIEQDLKYTKAQLQSDYRKSQLLALLLCIGSIDVALGNPQTEQRLIDVLTDLHESNVLNFQILNQ